MLPGNTGRQAPEYLAVDFFCGAGGTTRGLIDAGGYVIAGIDKDRKCEETFSRNNVNRYVDRRAPEFLNLDIFRRSREYPGGQQSHLFDELNCLIPYYKRKHPVTPLLFSICAPCQPFTKLSKKEALTLECLEARRRDSGLLQEAMTFVRAYKPELVLSENVAGIRHQRYGDVWKKFETRLRYAGYVTGEKIVCASRFGIPQNRKRSILLGVRKDRVNANRLDDLLGRRLLVPDYDPDAEIISVRKAIGHLPPIKAGEFHSVLANHCARKLSPLNIKRISSAMPGQSNAYMATTVHGDLTLDCHRNVNARLGTRCYSDVYTRMHPDRPAPTITTKCHSISNGRFGHFDTNQNRGISLLEAAILQSFPEDYIFFPEDDLGSVARMIGNAVPPKLAAFYAEYLVGCLEGKARCAGNGSGRNL